MSARWQRPFYAVDSTEPSFNSTLGSTSQAYALESTGAREFDGPSNRAVRVSNGNTDDYSLVFGDSAIVATSSGAMLILGGTVETFFLQPKQTHVAVASSTDVSVNITPGYGA